MASCDATGPPGTATGATSPSASGLATTLWSIGVTAFWALKFWMTPWAMKATASTRLTGRSTRVVARVMSTQKLPIVPLLMGPCRG